MNIISTVESIGFMKNLSSNIALTLIKLNDILNNVKNNNDNILNKIKEVISMDVFPDWLNNLEDEDIAFIKKFLLASGSLKEVANIYKVTYPTVRLRLDRLIQKIQISEDNSNEPYISLIKRMAVNEKIEFDTAKILISEYKKQIKESK